MKQESRRIILSALTTIGLFFLGVALVSGQSGPPGGAEKSLSAEQIFKNVQLLKGIPVDEFMRTMGFFSASTGMNCTECHTGESGGDWAKYADDTALKRRARAMIAMATALNRTYFGGRRVVTCWTCHRGFRNPRVIPDLSIQYGDALDAEPDEILARTSAGPSADQILNKYVEALGGAPRLSNLTSIAGKGTYLGFETAFAKVPVEVFAKAPDQRATIVHLLDGNSISTYDGHVGWLVGPETIRPMPQIALTGGELEGAKIDAELSFPARIKEVLGDWRVGFPENIDNREVQVVQGRLAKGGLPVKLYFDSISGLLVRLVRYTNSPVGVNPTQIDYADYREVSGIKMPFRWTVTWTDGRSTIELTELRVNVPIDATKFSKPAPSVPKSTTQQK
jgi:photosynthetic reaction center cytochrome c subunit